MSLEGKVVAVTGASAGVGRAAVRAFARRGAHVGLIARGEDRLRAAAAEVEERGRRACVAPADIADAAQVERAAERIESELGPIDVWMNAAMTAVLAEVADTRPEQCANCAPALTQRHTQSPGTPPRRRSRRRSLGR
jgi:short-subunit dehydrogenase